MPILPTFRTRWRDSNTAKRQDATFAQLWRNFESAGTVLDGRHEMGAWPVTAGKFAACVVRIAPESLNEDFSEFQGVLKGLELARVHPVHFLHIMLQELGLVIDDATRRHEITRGRLEEFADSAHAAVAGATPFEIYVGGPNAFRDAVILEVHDGGVLSRLHKRLNELAAVPTGSPYAYLPHLTVAHFVRDAPSYGVVEAIGPWRDRLFGHMTVEAVDIVLIDVDEIYPEFELYRTLELG
jgi:2'-5' RNA ligase